MRLKIEFADNGIIIDENGNKRLIVCDEDEALYKIFADGNRVYRTAYHQEICAALGECIAAEIDFRVPVTSKKAILEVRVRS